MNVGRVGQHVCGLRSFWNVSLRPIGDFVMPFSLADICLDFFFFKKKQHKFLLELCHVGCETETAGNQNKIS